MTDPRSPARAVPGYPAERPPFRCAVPIQIRFRDTDAMGHVNNAVYLTYLEIARTAYWHQVFAIANYNQVDFILARAEIDFARPLLIQDEAVVWIRVNEIGEKSFRFAYEIVTAAGVAARAETIQVMFDYAVGRSKVMASAQRSAILAFEAPDSVRERARSSTTPPR
jgi:acyl-CoA thioester hydrolase